MRQQLLAQSDIRDQEHGALVGLGLSVQHAEVDARAMFRAYEAQGLVELSSYQAYRSKANGSGRPRST